MGTKEQAEDFLDNSRHAIEHLFEALNAYYKVLDKAKAAVGEIEKANQLVSDLFVVSDQWSPNANHYYTQYLKRMEEMNGKMKESQEDDTEKMERAILSIGSTVESISSLAGAVLQIGKQALSLRHSGKPNLPEARKIGSQNIVVIIWEGRNHSMHWDEGEPRYRVRSMLSSLAIDHDITIEYGKNNCMSILGVLGWKTSNDVISDLKALVQ